MKEIEIKARLRDKESVMNQLKALGCVFSEPVTQEDVTYTQQVGSLQTYLSNKVFLRIRVKNNSEVIFTLKRPLDNLLNKIEHETTVGSKAEMEQAIFQMGYQKATRVYKTRIITHLKDCEICIDEVEGLGCFIEMEKLVEDGDGGKIQAELFQFFVSLGIDPQDRVSKGYDILMLEKG